MRSTGSLLMLAVFGVANAACSFVYTKGPQPEVQPPPECTTSNKAPIADTVFAAASVAAVVAGSILYADAAGSCCHSLESGYATLFPVAIGGLGILVFTPSAIVGYNRTAACRDSLEAKPQQPASPGPPLSSLLRVPPHGCPMLGDAPRVCSSAASWEPSAVVLGEAP